jgi:hypothetical protein
VLVFNTSFISHFLFHIIGSTIYFHIYEEQKHFSSFQTQHRSAPPSLKREREKGHRLCHVQHLVFVGGHPLLNNMCLKVFFKLMLFHLYEYVMDLFKVFFKLMLFHLYEYVMDLFKIYWYKVTNAMFGNRIHWKVERYYSICD